MSRNKSSFRPGNRQESHTRAGQVRSRRRLVPAVLVLEDRRLLATFTVTSIADLAPASDPTTGTLRWAVQQANLATTPSTIDFSLPGGAGTITLRRGQLELTNTDDSIIIDGLGVVSISGNNVSRVFQIGNNVTATLSGLTITEGGNEKDGGGLYSDGTTTLADCTISGNSAVSGGGVYNRGTLTVTSCTISGNSSQNVGGLASYAGTATLTDCTIDGNSGLYDCGGVYARGALTMSGCTISGNSTMPGTTKNGYFYPGYGVGGLETDGMANLSDCSISANYGGGTGGVQTAGTAYLSDCSISANRGDGVGGMNPVIGGTATLTGCTIDGNSSTYFGGLEGEASVTLNECTIGGNSGGWVGGLTFEKTTVTLDACVISGNTGGYVGGFANYSGGPTSHSTATLSDCTISNNLATKYGVVAGGVESTGTTTLAACTISGNSSSLVGGLDSYKNPLTLTDCTISGNSAYAVGGLAADGPATLTACTVSGNSGIENGGLGIYKTAILTDTIVAGNTNLDGASDIYGTVSGSANLVGTGGSGGLTNGDDNNIVGVSNPMLAPLANYGGPTETMALLPGSPALGAGTPVSGTTSDQRGLPLDAHQPDIGAFQSQGFILSIAAGSPQSTGINAPFASPLVITVTANNSVEPVIGGVIKFVAPNDGASATLSSGTAGIGSNGRASVTASANGTFGAYVVTAAANPAAAPADFSLTNTIQPAFSNLAGPTIVYGTPTATLAGTILAGSTVPTGSVSITLDDVTQTAPIEAGGGFSSVFDTTGLSVAGSPFTIDYSYAADGGFAAASNSSQGLTVTPAAPTIAVSDAGGVYTGNPFPATATVAGVNETAGTSLEGVPLTLTYYSGTAASGTALAGAPSAPCTYTVLASFPGSPNYSSASETATFSITQAVITGLSVRWGVNGSAVLNPPTAAGGLILAAGRTTDLPWLGIDQITLTLNAAEPLMAADVSIKSAIGVDYGPVTMSGSGTTYTITLATPIMQADRLTIAIGSLGISTFDGQLAVLPGDLNDDGVVNAADLALVRDQIVGILPMTIFGDIAGDGTTDMNDYNTERRLIGTTLPPEDS